MSTGGDLGELIQGWMGNAFVRSALDLMVRNKFDLRVLIMMINDLCPFNDMV